MILEGCGRSASHTRGAAEMGRSSDSRPAMPAFDCGAALQELGLGQLFDEDFDSAKLLWHVVVAIVVTRLHARQAMRLKVAANVAPDPLGCKQRFDARTNALELEALDRLAHYFVRPAGKSPHVDGLLACRR